MNTYLSTFTSGLSEVIEDALTKRLKDVKIVELLDGMIRYETRSNSQTIKQIPFFVNSFLELAYSSEKEHLALPILCQKFIKGKPIMLQELLGTKPRAFRIVTSEENQGTAISETLLKNLELKVSRDTGLMLNRTSPHFEFWVMKRREGQGFFALRLTKNSEAGKGLQRGELRSELAYLVALLSDPRPTDTILDPFAGLGSLPGARAELMPYTRMYVGDMDPLKVKRLKGRFGKQWETITISQYDGTSLTEIKDASIDAIITDPPWGIYDNQISDLKEFYSKTLSEFERVLKKQGNLIILMARGTVFEESLVEFTASFALLKRYDILVSGKKATIFKLKKKG